MSNYAAPALMGNHAESVTVGVDGGSEREGIDAIVDRNPPAPADGRASKPSMTITLYNDATTGIDITAFNAGKYYVKVARVVGGATIDKLYLHGKPTVQDSGMLTFEV